MIDPWWNDFFDVGAHAQIQDALEKNNAAEADWIVERLSVRPPVSLLDVPCGEGRICRELAARGFGMTGVDLTPALLQAARERAGNARLKIHFDEKDMRDLPWKETFDGAFCHFGSFGYFDEEGNRTFVRTVLEALKPGARFVVDTHTTETLLPTFSPRDWHWMGETLVLQERRYSMRTHRVNCEWTYFKDGNGQKAHSSIRLYSYPELCQLLESAGFSGCEGFDPETRGPFSVKSKRLTMVARKP